MHLLGLPASSRRRMCPAQYRVDNNQKRIGHLGESQHQHLPQVQLSACRSSYLPPDGTCCEFLFDGLAEVMIQAEVRLLNEGRGTGGYGKEMVGEGNELTASFPGEGNGRDLHCTCLFKGCNDIRRGSRSADADQNGAGLAISLNLAGEDCFEAVVVGASREDGSIGRKANDIEGLTIEQEAADQ